MILEIYCSGPALTNCVLLACDRTKKGVIVDAPLDVGEQLIERIEELGLSMEMLLLTHSHWDHTADAAFLKKKLKIPVYVHKLDAQNLEEPGSDGLPLLVDIPKVIPDHFLQDNQELILGDLVLKVIHTPGHTPGGVCFYLEKEKTLLSGDTIFRGTIGNLSFPTSDPDKMWHSLERLSKIPPETRVIPGHGEETTIGQEKWLPDAKEFFGG